jgi:hypothetical protein
MNWYEILQNKDGSISSCKKVSTGLRDGKFVHYVQANSPEEAIKILLDRYQRRTARLRDHSTKLRATRRRQGVCVRCGKEPPKTTSTICEACTDRALKHRRNRDAGIRINSPKAKTDAERVDRECSATKRRRRRPRDWQVATKRAFVRCLEAFDQMTPSSFRTWLVEELNKAQEQERASAERRGGAQGIAA